MVHLSISCRSRGSERGSGSRGPAHGVWNTRQALADVRLFALLVIATLRMTEYPDWHRLPRGPQAISVQLPPLERNARILFLDDLPYAFAVLSMPESARVIGVNNNLVHPGSPGRLWSMIEAAVRDHQGPLGGVEDRYDHPSVADVSLTSLRLARDRACAPLITNMEVGEHAKICRLRRGSTP